MRNMWVVSVILILIGVMSSALLSCSVDDSMDGDNQVYEIGDEGPAGGLIFYIDADGEFEDWDYLELAPTDTDRRIYWVDPTKNAMNELKNATLPSDIGSGSANTTVIASHLFLSFAESAANDATNYSVTSGGVEYDDWFLPSELELKALYTFITSDEYDSITTFPMDYVSPHIGDRDIVYRYWSSSVASESPRVVDFSDGTRTYDTHDTLNNVRPIRSFK
ncbi:MAG: hypothetical protein JXK93_00155 [Sphaerochaetaceae bacterium]|nr:hypothetical protein [Sphaerochaetaceae bacterium]